MREAIGGALSIQLIAIFLFIINAYLAFNVNYTKAFNVKNEIINIIEKFEGYTGDTNPNGDGGSCTNGNNACNQIADYLEQIAYPANDFQCADGFHKKLDRFCIRSVQEGYLGSTSNNSQYMGSHYEVQTFVPIAFPGLDKILPIFSQVFSVRGETSVIYSSGTNTEIQD